MIWELGEHQKNIQIRGVISNKDKWLPIIFYAFVFFSRIQTQNLHHSTPKHKQLKRFLSSIRHCENDQKKGIQDNSC